MRKRGFLFKVQTGSVSKGLDGIYLLDFGLCFNVDSYILDCNDQVNAQRIHFDGFLYS